MTMKILEKYLPENGTILERPTDLEKIDMCLKHLNLLLEVKNEKLACLEIRSHIGWYFKGIKCANELKNKVYHTNNIHDIISLLIDFKEENSDGKKEW